MYTTQSTASIRLTKAPNSNLKLKIQKVKRIVFLYLFFRQLYLLQDCGVVIQAVDCPFNLGTESQCGRVVDEVSCYCATFTKVSWWQTYKWFGTIREAITFMHFFKFVLTREIIHPKGPIATLTTWNYCPWKLTKKNYPFTTHGALVIVTLSLVMKWHAILYKEFS